MAVFRPRDSNADDVLYCFTQATKINNYGEGVNETPGPISEGASNAVRLTLLGKDGESGAHTMIKASQDEYSKTMEGKDQVVTVPW